MALSYGVGSNLNGCVLYLDASNPKSYPGAGNTWYDLSGNGLNATLTNGPTFNNSYGGCIQNDGVNDYISVAHNSVLNFGTGDFTILMWVSGIAGYPGCVPALLWKGANFSNNNAGYTMAWACNSPALYFITADGSSKINFTDSPIYSLNGWTGVKMIGMRRSGGNLYQINNGITTLLGASALNVNNSSTMYFAYDATYNGYLSCKIHAVQMFNRGVSDSELTNVFAATRNRYFGTLPFSPTDISGLQLWLDADDPRTLYSNTSGTTKATTDGTTVALWVDKSGNAYNASQSNASYVPTFKQSIQNGRNILRFDGANDHLNCGDVIEPASTISIFAVAKAASTGQYCVFSKGGSGSYYNAYTLFFNVSGTNTHASFNTGAVGTGLSISSTTGQYYLLEGTYNGSAMYHYQNGNPTTTALSGNLVYNSDNLRIGSMSDGAISFPLNGDIGEILIYNTALSAANRIKIETYLNNKWGLWSSFTPSSISGLKLWLDSSDPATLYQDTGGVIPAFNDGDPVALWKDKSGNNVNFSQSTAASRPLLKTNIQNSKNIIRFDGSNDFIQPSGFALGPQPVTVFTVFKTNGTGYHNIYDTGASNPMMWIDGSGQIEFDISGYRSSSVLNTATLVSYVNASSGGSISINGVTATTPYNVGLSSSSTTFFNRGGGQTYKGDFYEIIIYNSALSTAQRQQVEQYLNQKWGIF